MAFHCLPMTSIADPEIQKESQILSIDHNGRKAAAFWV
jgi:hypothetical protein